MGSGLNVFVSLYIMSFFSSLYLPFSKSPSISTLEKSFFGSFIFKGTAAFTQLRVLKSFFSCTLLLLFFYSKYINISVSITYIYIIYIYQ